MSHRLTVIAGPDQGKSFPVTGTGPVVIGRGHKTATQLADAHVSRVHCEVKLEGGKVLVADLDSAGGTFVNGARVRQQPLQPGDVIQVGHTRLRLEKEGAAPEQPRRQTGVVRSADD